MPEAANLKGRLSLLLLTALTFALPFELQQPLLAIGPLSISNLELVLAIFLVSALWSAFGGDIQLTTPKSWLILLSLFWLGSLLSGIAAPQFQGNAIKAAGRTLSGLALTIAVPFAARSARDRQLIALAAVTGLSLSAVFGLVELGSGQPLNWLSAFRQQPSYAGPFLRLAGTFDYANQASMFAEAALILAMGLSLQAWANSKRALAVSLFSAGILIAISQILTLSRGGWLTLALVAMLLLAIPNIHSKKWSGYSLALGAVILLIPGSVILLSSFFIPAVQFRLGPDHESSWYQLDISHPTQVEIAAGQNLEVELDLSNQSRFTWDSQAADPYRIGARWIDPEDPEIVVKEQRFELDEAILPGETARVLVSLVAPSMPGRYWVEWDIVQEGVTFFSYKTGQHFLTEASVNVSGAPNDRREVGQIRDLAPRAITPPRLVLWTIAMDQFLERPLLGIGLDNFRLSYGQELGWEQWNTTIHSNSTYLEILSSLGLTGTIPFFLWLGVLSWSLIQGLRLGNLNHVDLALAGALLAFIIHGFIDYFLLFNSTGLLFWLLAGLWSSILVDQLKSPKWNC